jgi:hypothetical protein
MTGQARVCVSRGLLLHPSCLGLNMVSHQHQVCVFWGGSASQQRWLHSPMSHHQRRWDFSFWLLCPRSTWLCAACLLQALRLAPPVPAQPLHPHPCPPAVAKAVAAAAQQQQPQQQQPVHPARLLPPQTHPVTRRARLALTQQPLLGQMGPRLGRNQAQEEARVVRGRRPRLRRAAW